MLDVFWAIIVIREYFSHSSSTRVRITLNIYQKFAESTSRNIKWDVHLTEDDRDCRI
jgi:hypothetical protein